MSDTTTTTFLPGLHVTRSARRTAQRWLRRAAGLATAATARGYQAPWAWYLSDDDYRRMWAPMMAAFLAGGYQPPGDWCGVWDEGRENFVLPGDAILGRPVILVGGDDPAPAEAVWRRLVTAATGEAVRGRPRLAWFKGNPLPAGAAAVLVRAAFSRMAEWPRAWGIEFAAAAYKATSVDRCRGTPLGAVWWHACEILRERFRC